MKASLTKVSMNLTERDIKNTESVRHLFHVRTNADAVSAALGITRSLGEMVKNGGEIFIRNKKGELQKVLIPGLDNGE
jgi:hypothetical protein